VQQFRKLFAVLQKGGPMEEIEAWVRHYLAK
jgi:hypothetical protein